MVNKVILVGNAGMDPEVRVFENGGKIARLRLATTERIYNPTTQQQTDHTEWHTLIFRRGLAGVVEMYVKKGSQLYVEGRIRSRQWEDASKVQHTSVEIYVDDMRMIGGRRDDAPRPGGFTPAAAPAGPAVQNPAPARMAEMQQDIPLAENDDLPF